MLALYHNAIMAKNSNESNSFYLSHHVISSRKARDRVDLDIGWYYYNYNAHALRWKIECLIVYIVLHIIYLFVNFKSIIFSNAIWPGKKWSHITKPVQASMSFLTRGSNLTTRKQRSGPLLNASLASIIIHVICLLFTFLCVFQLTKDDHVVIKKSGVTRVQFKMSWC